MTDEECNAPTLPPPSPVSPEAKAALADDILAEFLGPELLA